MDTSHNHHPTFGPHFIHVKLRTHVSSLSVKQTNLMLSSIAICKWPANIIMCHYHIERVTKRASRKIKKKRKKRNVIQTALQLYLPDCK